MKKLKLLYSYEEYKEKNNSSIWSSVNQITEQHARMLELSMNFNRTNEEEQELKELQKQTAVDMASRDFTEKVHKITEYYIDLKTTFDNDKREDIYNNIGRLQCEIEVMKEKYER